MLLGAEENFQFCLFTPHRLQNCFGSTICSTVVGRLRCAPVCPGISTLFYLTPLILLVAVASLFAMTRFGLAVMFILFCWRLDTGSASCKLSEKKLAKQMKQFNKKCLKKGNLIEYEIFGEGSQISTNQKRENSAFSHLVGWNLRPFPENFVLYLIGIFNCRLLGSCRSSYFWQHLGVTVISTEIKYLFPHYKLKCFPLYGYTKIEYSGFTSSLAGCLTKGDPTGLSNRNERKCKKKEKKLGACGYICKGIQGIWNYFIALFYLLHF